MIAYFCVGEVAHAQTTVNLKLITAGSNAPFGVYTGPYTLQVNGAGTIQAVCDDFSHDTSINQQWQANTYAWSWSNVQHARFYNSFGLQGYEEVAYLVEKMNANLNNPDLVADIHYAIWAIFTPSIMTEGQPGNDGFDAGAQAIYTEATGITNFSDYDFSSLTIYDPVSTSSNSPQEFIGTPEPASMMLFGTGLLAIGTAIRRRPLRKVSV